MFYHILEVEEQPFKDLQDIFEKTFSKVAALLENKTFAVRVKRRGQHDFSSIDVERYVGGGLNQHIDSAKVKLTKPDITINIELDGDQMLLVKDRIEGLSGYPIGTQEDVLSLISGGFDSGVSSYMLMRRGSRVHYCFFNLGGYTHEIGVKQMAYHLWSRYSSSHKVRFIKINFEPVVAEILEKIDNGQMGVILKRMMIRAASKVAERFNIQALVTGEAIGQVSSQTLTNLRRINEVTDNLILRPLISHDKEDIIKVAEKIGTADIAKSMPEFCGVISNKPTVKAVKEKIEEEELHFDFSILEKVVNDVTISSIKDIDFNLENDKNNEVETVSFATDKDVIIDIRSQDEIEEKPIAFQTECIHIPFYKLASKFPNLNQNKTYLLFCDKGVMSKLQAAYIKELGYTNIKILKYKKVSS